MAKEKFIEKRLTGTIEINAIDPRNNERFLFLKDKATLCKEILEAVNTETDGGRYRTTGRHVYYKLVGKNQVRNAMVVYKKVLKVLDELRYSGLLDWSLFVDNEREAEKPYQEDGPEESIQRVIDYYRLDRQDGQPKHLEVWTEKMGHKSYLEPIKRKYGFLLSLNKGYNSSVMQHEAYLRVAYSLERGKPVVILYVGDHDPSGLDMIRDIRERLILMLARSAKHLRDVTVIEWLRRNEILPEETLETLSKLRRFLGQIEDPKGAEKLLIEVREMYIKKFLTVKHIALTMEQIQRHDLPPNFAKLTDKRAAKYVEKFGKISWEVEALTREDFMNYVEEAVVKEMDMDIYNYVLKQEREDKAMLAKAIVKMFEDED